MAGVAAHAPRALLCQVRAPMRGCPCVCVCVLVSRSPQCALREWRIEAEGTTSSRVFLRPRLRIATLTRKAGVVERMALRLLQRVCFQAAAQLMFWAVCVRGKLRGGGQAVRRREEGRLPVQPLQEEETPRGCPGPASVFFALRMSRRAARAPRIFRKGPPSHPSCTRSRRLPCLARLDVRLFRPPPSLANASTSRRLFPLSLLPYPAACQRVGVGYVWCAWYVWHELCVWCER